MTRQFLITILLFSITLSAHAQRARDLGIPFEGRPGPINAITDVAGVTVGHTTLISDTADGHAIRTGVTAILPRGKDSLMQPVMAATFALNGNGEMTGSDLGGRIRSARRACHDHQHPQCRHRARCHHRLAYPRSRARRQRLHLVATAGGRDLGRSSQ